jgi:two-component system invasion response regulator UvrY
MIPDKFVRIAIVDDHSLFRKGLINLILSFNPSYSISIEAENGYDLLEQLQTKPLPHILIMDLSMPKMDGFELAQQLRLKYPTLPILVVSMIHQEMAVMRMLRVGVKGYLSKDINPDELSQAIKSILNNDYHYTDILTGRLLNFIATPVQNDYKELSERELIFLKLLCSEYTYQEIADKMSLSVKTVDGYRASLFIRFNTKTRTGLVLYGIKNGLVMI